MWPGLSMRVFQVVPLFAYLLLIANYAMFESADGQSLLNVIVLQFTLPSTRTIVLTLSDALILAAICTLYLETFKATHTSDLSIVEHALSLVVFIVFLIEFLIFPEVGNATFLILMVASLMDVIIGFTVTISTARRDMSIGN